MKATSIKGKTPKGIQWALEQRMTDGFTPTLATGFVSIIQDRDAICGLLQKEGILILRQGTSPCWAFSRWVNSGNWAEAALNFTERP